MIGKTLGHYQITEKLGEGGMGVVYKARDTHLDRFVAIKVLPPERVADPERKRRFIQEAKAASALNHPNIITIHDIDQADGVDFIAMEYVAGKTLDELIPRKGLRLSLALKYAVQIADALARAHGTGIIHRDLKPSNVMVDEHGLVKVLDFGLAKLTEGGPVGDDASTRTVEASTERGTIVGTVAYMSPEQAEGKRVDARSDVFSLGSVLYEMVTGQKAFQGTSKMSTLSAVLHQESKPIEDAPQDLKRIIAHCLRKDPDRRFQNMKDLKVELEELKEESDSQKLAPQLTGGRRGKRWGRLLVYVAATACTMAVVTAGWLWWVRSSNNAATAVVQLTTSKGTEGTPALSPDGKQYAYSWTREGNTDIYVSQVGVEGAQRLTDHPDVDIGPQWSPDGQYIAFTRCEGSLGGWRRIQHIVKPQRGGREQIIAESDLRKAGIHPGIQHFLRAPALTWMPNSRRLLVVGLEADEQGRQPLLLVSASGEVLKEVLKPPEGYRLIGFPSLSVKADALAFAAFRSQGNASLFVSDFDSLSCTTSDMRSTAAAGRAITGIAWVEGSKDLIYADQAGLWRVHSHDMGKPKKLDFSVEGDYSPAYSFAEKRLIFSRIIGDTDNYRLEISETGIITAAPVALPWNSTKIDCMADISPDGSQAAFTSNRSGEWEIWVGGPNAEDTKQLTSFGGPLVNEPRWSADGKWIAFYSSAEGGRDIYVISAAGGRPTRLTKDEGENSSPAWSPDGRLIYYINNRQGMMRISVQGGESVTILPNCKGWRPAISMDGKFIYFAELFPRPGLLLRAPAEGGKEEIIATNLWGANYALVGKRLYYMAGQGDGGGFPLMEMDLPSGKARQIALLPLDSISINSFLSARSDSKGTVLVFSQGRPLISDLMLVENFR